MSRQDFLAMRTRIALVASLIVTQACSDASAPQLLQGAPPTTTVSFPPDVHLSARIDRISAPPNSWAPIIHLTNDGMTQAPVAYGPCSVAVWIYHSGAVSGVPAWDNRASSTLECFATATLLFLPPGSPYDINGGTYNRPVIGESLPAGIYKVVVALRPETPADAPLIVLPAGTISLP
jgi:hypothetical protein